MAALGLSVIGGHLFLTHVEGVAPKSWMVGREKSEWYGVWQIETMYLDGREVPATDSARWRYFAVERGRNAWIKTAMGQRHAIAFTLAGDGMAATVRPLAGNFTDEGWSLTRGLKTVRAWSPVPLRNEDRNKPIDVEVRTLKVSGRWQGQPLEFEAFEKPWKLQTGFRLRQELPDYW